MITQTTGMPTYLGVQSMVRYWLIACPLLFQTTQTAVIKEQKKKLAQANKQKSKKRGKKKEKALLAFAPEHRDPLNIPQAKQCNFVSGFFKTVIEPGDRWQKVKFSPEDKYFH